MKKWGIPLLIFLAGCGYHHYPTSAQYKFDVPFIKGDKDGQLTASVIKSLSKSPFLQYDPSQPQILITANIDSAEAEQIGYQYRMKDNDSEVQDRLVPNEGRRSVIVTFQIKTPQDSEPYKMVVEGNSDYDFVDPDSFKALAFNAPNGELVTVLAFSLGQLDSEEGAKLASFSPCYGQVAAKFSERLSRYISQNCPIVRKEYQKKGDEEVFDD
jgi:hypothetical protein